MKISEFIGELQRQKEEHGDIAVITPCMDEIDWCFAEVSGAIEIKGELMLEINYDGDMFSDS